MSLYFSSEEYKKRALEDARKHYVNNHTILDAFFLLIEGADPEDLSNLCKEIQGYYAEDEDCLSLEECYSLTQRESVPKKKLTEDTERLIFRKAYVCLRKYGSLGTKTINDGKINTSDWMGHCLWEGELALELAALMNLDCCRAMKMGILHDYGRKASHDTTHITRGYEMLSDKGWSESISCLTHSFLRGGRCSWNDQPEEGFYVDEEGNPQWLPNCVKDDIMIFLENYSFTKYDIILNIADLMATSKGIVSPAERIADIATRRKEFDPRNRLYFLADLTNTLVWCLQKIGGDVPDDLKEPVKAKKGVTLEEITEKFERASEVFFEIYKSERYVMF